MKEFQKRRLIHINKQKIISYLFIILVGGIIYLIKSNALAGTLDYLESVFIIPILTGIEAIGQGDKYVTVGIVLIVISIGFYIFFAFMMKLLVIDVVFPKLRTIDEFKNRINHTRLICRSKDPENIFEQKPINDIFSSDINNNGNDEYYWTKFHLLPILEFHRIKLDKNWKRRRLPWTLDIYTNNINLNWSTKDQAWEFKKETPKMSIEDTDWYKDEATENIHSISNNVLMGVKGDYGLIKDKFKLGLSVQKIKRPSEDEEDGEEDGEE